MKTKLFFIVCLFFALSLQAKVKKADTLEIKTKEVVISALRYPESLIEVPLAINLITPEQFIFSRNYGIDQALNNIPGVLAQSRAGSQDVKISIRGFGARGAGDRSNAGTSRGLKFILDGVPETEPDGRTSFDLIDPDMASSIEVIRSNASAIWGNAAGGVISFNTVPVFDSPFLQLDASGGSFGSFKYLFQTGTNINNSKLYSQFSMSKSNGWRMNSASERYLLNVGLRSVISPKTLFGMNIIGTSSEFQIPGPLTLDQFNNYPDSANKTYNNNQERRYNRIARISANLEHNFDANNSIYSNLFVSPKFLQRSERGTFRDFTRYYLGASGSFKHHYNISDDLKNTLLIGFDESYQDGAILFYKLLNKSRGDLKTDKKEGANSFGAYLQDEFKVLDKISVLLGLRYDRIDYYNALYYENPDFFPSFTENRTFDQLTPKAAVSFRFSTEHSVYLSYGGGVEVPAGNETDPIGDTILVNNLLNKPIISSTIEFGTKQFINIGSDFLRNLSYDLALYYITTKNDLVPYGGGKYYMPASKTLRTGIEASLNLSVTKTISLTGALSFSSNKYDDYLIDSVFIDPKLKGSANFKDNKMAGLPDMFYSATLRYYNPELLGLLAEVGVNGVGTYYADDGNHYSVPSYSIINAKAGLDNISLLKNDIILKIWFAANNLTNRNYSASSYINPLLLNGKAMYLEPGLPRNVNLGISFCWK